MFGGPAYYDSYFPSYGSYHNAQHRHADPEHLRALAAQRARRTQWLPDEVGDFDDDGEYNRLGPQEKAWLDAHHYQAAVERERQRRLHEEARRRAEMGRRWQQQLDRRQEEDTEVRQRGEEEKAKRRRVQQRQHQQQQTPRDGDQRFDVQQRPSHTPNGHIFSPQLQLPHESPSPPHASDQTPDQRGPSKSPPLHPPLHPKPEREPQYEQKHINAASTIHHHFRIHQSLRVINSLSSQFHNLRKEFTQPSILSFQNPASPPNSTDVINIPVLVALPSGNVDSVDKGADGDLVDGDISVPKLAFNSTNYALHAYLEALDKFLIELDGVESWGDQDVRVRRRAAVKEIEEEQERLDKMVKDSWLKRIQDVGAKA